MILYEDKDLIVCRKPAKIPVQSAKIGQKDMVSMLNNYLAEQRIEDGKRLKNEQKKNKMQEAEMIRVVHRLDQPVEGILVFAKTKRAASELGKQLTDGRMEKIYQAVCCVTDEAERKFELEVGKTFELTDYLIKNGKTNTSVIAKAEDRDAKCARLAFKIKDMVENDSLKYLLAGIHLETGRHHQIRVQMANAGLPLYGDQKYHKNWSRYVKKEQITDKNNAASKQIKNPRAEYIDLALCAASLTFFHPITGKKMSFEVNPENEIFSIFQ